MKTTLLDAKKTHIALKRLMNESTEFHWAVAWATETALSKLLLTHKNKIRHLVFGTDFAHTSPGVLRNLEPVKSARIMIRDGKSTFHPKVYCFISGNRMSAIVGSANFTHGGTHLNSEAAILLEGTVQDEPLQEIRDKVLDWWGSGSPITKDFLNSYELRWRANRKHRKAIESPLHIYSPSKQAKYPDILFTPWTKYLKKIKAEGSERLAMRLAVLDRAGQLFDSQNSFNKLSDLERRAIAGFIGDKQLAGSVVGINWGWFGSMTAARTFKNLIIQNNRHFSIALDHIPPIGEVTEDDYIAFAEEFKKATGGIATPTRLLAMKRPDYFVCLDSANKDAIAKNFGFAPSTLCIDNYWERVIDPITQSSWWNSKRPRGRDGKIWDYRAAFLDAIFYEH